ncbi:SseB family protein [Streptomyces sp. NPDC051940]|uniref:SseB family protein n=1 Tax=Streptomyces sp. NPDC051940 TaxID=3155675 RepID=UPI003443AEC2
MAPKKHPDTGLKNIPDSGFADDDGSADPRLTAALAAWAAERTAETESGVLAALAGVRLLVPVVAVLGEVEEGPDGLKREKTSDMAVPTLNTPDGRRALPAFTSTDALARWDAGARPVAVPLQQAIRATVSEQADTLVLDVAGPVPYALTGPALLAAAEGRTSTDPLADPAVADALRALLAAAPSVVRAYLGPSRRADGTLALAVSGDDPAAEAQRVAAAVAADPALRARLVRGLDLALLPADAVLSAPPFYER